MWTWFRAIAASIGLSPETVEEVERGGVQATVAHPVDPNIRIIVRPDPDWTARLEDAWNGTLVNSRRASAGMIPIPGGRILVGDPSEPERVIGAEVAPGDYDVVVTIAHLGTEGSEDYEEQVSHAFALLRGNEGVALIEPMRAADRTEIFVDAAIVGFTGPGVADRLAAEHAGGRPWALGHYLIREKHAAGANGHWVRVAPGEGGGALIAVGARRDRYPLFRMADANGRTVGVMVDFNYDNRPYD